MVVLAEKRGTAAEADGARKSDYRGVSWSKDQQTWRAQIVVDGKGRHLGCFMDEEEAARAYGAACREIGRDPTRPQGAHCKGSLS